MTQPNPWMCPEGPQVELERERCVLKVLKLSSAVSEGKPLRTGSRERPSFMVMVDLKSGSCDSDFWIKRGTALLLSLST